MDRPGALELLMDGFAHHRRHSMYLVLALFCGFLAILWFFTWPGFKNPLSFAWWSSLFVAAVFALGSFASFCVSTKHLNSLQNIEKRMRDAREVFYGN